MVPWDDGKYGFFPDLMMAIVFEMSSYSEGCFCLLNYYINYLNCFMCFISLLFAPFGLLFFELFIEFIDVFRNVYERR